MISVALDKVNATFNELNATGQLNIIKNNAIVRQSINFYEDLEVLEHTILVNSNQVFYARVFPVLVEAISIDTHQFISTEHGLTSDYQSPDLKEHLNRKYQNIDFRHKLTNAIALVILTNSSNKNSVDQSIAAAQNLLDVINAEIDSNSH